MSEVRIAVQEDAPQRQGAGLHGHLDQLEPQEHPPGRDPLHRQYLVLVVPAPGVGLDHLAVLDRCEERRPAVRRGIDELDLVGIVAQQVTERAPVVAVAFLLEAEHVGGHGNDSVLAQQADGLTVLADVRPLVDARQRGLVVALDAEQEADNSGPAIEVEDVSVAHDVAGTGGADQQQRNILGDQRLEEGPPGLARAGG
ncbi:hypothetical protein D3C84_598410 [compost metagenome]